MEAVSGKKLVYLFRVNEDEGTDAGKCIAFTTENSRSVTVSADSIATKDGSIRVPTFAEQEITATALMAKDDDRLDKYEEAMKKGKIFDIWEANLDAPIPPNETGDDPKFKGKYWQGYLTEMELSSNSEDFVEVSYTFGLNGDGESGNVTVTVEEQEIADYVFRDTPIVTTEDEDDEN